MANTSLAILLDQKDALNIATPSTRTGRQLLRMVINHLEGIAAGNKRADNMKLWVDGAIPQRAVGLLTVATASGTVGGTINGVSATGTATGDDEDDAALIAAAINASSNALIQYIVQASNLAATITLSTCLAGTRVTVCGYDFTAKSGAPLEPEHFNIDGNDTADAASLAAQINARPGLRDIGFATSSSGVVTFRQWSGTTAAGLLATTNSTTAAVTALASSAVVQVSALLPGIAGNCVTLAASGTGITASVARLAGGTGLGVAVRSISLPGGVS